MKKKFLFSIALFLSMGFNTFAQTLVTQVKPAGSKTWGYVNLKGELIIPAQYAKCYKFSREGFAPIYDTEKKQYYFINLKGETLNTEVQGFKLIDGFGLDINGFQDGLVPVRVGEKWGYLNTSGKLAIPAVYDKVSEFNSDRAVVEKLGKHIVIDIKGVEMPVEIADLVDVKNFSEQFAPYKVLDKTFGFIGVDGKVAIKAQFQSVGYFSNGLAWAKSADGMLGYINTKGEWVIKPQFTGGKEFSSNGFARIKQGAEWAYVNKAGVVTTIKISEKYEDFFDGLAAGKKGEKFGFYNAKGEWAIEPMFDGVRDFKNGYAAAKQGTQWGIVDKTGKWVIEPKFDGIKDMEFVK